MCFMKREFRSILSAKIEWQIGGRECLAAAQMGLNALMTNGNKVKCEDRFNHFIRKV